MKLDKKVVNEVIRLTRKYFKTGDVDYLPTLREAREALGRSVSRYNAGLIEDLARYTQRSRKGTYNDIYRALAVFGIIVEEKEGEKKKNMRKFKVGDVAMYKDKLVHIADIQETNTKRTNLFGEIETEYRYVVEENRLQTIVQEYELVEIKNQSSYLIIPRK